MDGFVGLEPAFGVPAEASCDEVEEGFVFAFQGLLERFGAGASSFTLRRHCEAGFAQGVEEEFLASGFFDEVLLRWTEDFHYAC